MAGNNFSETSKGFYVAAPDAEIERRIMIISAEKRRLGRDLSALELDRLLPPVDCLRTRLRLAKAARARR